MSPNATLTTTVRLLCSLILRHPFLSKNLSDGMPPLVDNPNPSMTFTFFTDMTPITALSADPTIPFETLWENPVPASASPVDFAELPESQVTFQGPDRASHGKKRDASYIPRPPNAFILFRSSFIRSQQVPEKVEGNHSTLSKIIGKRFRLLIETLYAIVTGLQVNIGKRFPVKRERFGRQRRSLLRRNIGNDTPTGALGLEPTLLRSSKSRMDLRRRIENGQIRLHGRSKEILRIGKRKVATRDVQ